MLRSNRADDDCCRCVASGVAQILVEEVGLEGGAELVGQVP